VHRVASPTGRLYRSRSPFGPWEREESGTSKISVPDPNLTLENPIALDHRDGAPIGRSPIERRLTRQ
jgi:hypothetical protein